MDFSHSSQMPAQALTLAAGQACAARAASGEAAPRVVTTGRKTISGRAQNVVARDADTGEPVDVYSTGRRTVFTRHPEADEAADPGIAFVDALAFSLVPPEPHSFQWLIQQMRAFLPIDAIQERKGCFGFTNSLVFGDGAGLMAWGGKSQRGRVYFSLMGKGCGLVSDWQGIAEWLEAHNAVIKRCDLAHDDFAGKLVSIAWAVDQYQGDGFTAGGRKPRHSVFGDWLAGDAASAGRTLAIGNRASGKYCRVYEKGRQLGDASSAWTRIEVEFRAQDRWIPFDVLTRPGHYLAGAYPCLAFLAELQSSIKTIAKAAQVAFDRAVENGKQSCGKLVNLMLSVVGGDYAEVVKRLRRDGFPARIDPYSYHVSRDPSMLDYELREVPA